MVSPGHVTPPPAQPLLTMRGVSKQFGGTQALADAGIEVGAGEIVALLGENGAGKSTLIKILAGVHVLDGGTISYRGREVTYGAALRHLPIAFIHQDLGLIEWMTVAENISLMLGFPRRFGVIDWNATRGRAIGSAPTLIRISESTTFPGPRNRWSPSRERWPPKRKSWCSTNQRRASRPTKWHVCSQRCAGCARAVWG
jgi:ABC-type glutathione transport system ATPase component